MSTKPKRWTLDDICQGNFPYTESDIDGIVEAADGLPNTPLRATIVSYETFDILVGEHSRRDVLRYRLTRAALGYWGIDALETLRSIRFTHQLAHIQECTAQLIGALSVPTGSGYREVMKWQAIHNALLRGFGKLSTVGEIIESLQDLCKRAESTQDDHEARAKTAKIGRAGRSEDKALNALIRELLSIWVEIFEREPRTSVGSPGTPTAGRASGPLIDFIGECLKPLDISWTHDGLRGRIRRLKQKKKGT